MARIKILPPETARLIAAGEVIDRPASALRELLDNALDAGATEIEVRVEQGGISLLGVSDNGDGMDSEDLTLSVVPHATSKIATAEDLLRAKTLGFRGEALGSIAAVARLEIVSKNESSAAASRLLSGPGIDTVLETAAGRKGTSVTVTGMFDRYPARRQFLKRPQAEASLCRQTFADKALAHPGVQFRWISGSSRETCLPETRARRICSFHPEIPQALLYELQFSGNGFSGTVVLAGPSFHRPDRRLMQVFVNRRRVQEWGLLGALDYAFSGFLPGGMKPCAFLFVEVDPALADFNIHPAKREVRFKSPDEIRRAITNCIQTFLPSLARVRPEETFLYRESALGLESGSSESPGEFRFPYASSGGIRDETARARRPGGAEKHDWSEYESVAERLVPIPREETASTGSTGGFRYLGQTLGPFLLFEMENSLYVMDQHAAHERILFDHLNGKDIRVQKLLVPAVIEPEDDEQEKRLEAMADEFASAGFVISREGDAWILTSVPEILGDRAFGLVMDLVANGLDRAFHGVRASMACKAAIKDGDRLDRAAAENLITLALALPEPRCPHGRPIWTQFTREHLFRLAGRIV